MSSVTIREVTVPITVVTTTEQDHTFRRGDVITSPDVDSRDGVITRFYVSNGVTFAVVVFGDDSEAISVEAVDLRPLN